MPGSPGLGISALFFVVTALFMPVHAGVRIARGQSPSRDWRTVATQAGISLVVLTVVALTLWAFRRVFVGDDDSLGARLGGLIPLVPVAYLTLLGVVAVLASAASWLRRIGHAGHTLIPVPAIAGAGNGRAVQPLPSGPGLPLVSDDSGRTWDMSNSQYELPSNGPASRRAKRAPQGSATEALVVLGADGSEFVFASEPG